MKDFLNEFMENNFYLFALGFAKSDKDKERILKMNELCKEHNISFKSFFDVLTGLNEWERNND